MSYGRNGDCYGKDTDSIAYAFLELEKRVEVLEKLTGLDPVLLERLVRALERKGEIDI